LLAGLHKIYTASFHKIWWKDGNGPWKKAIDFGGNLDPRLFLPEFLPRPYSGPVGYVNDFNICVQLPVITCFGLQII